MNMSLNFARPKKRRQKPRPHLGDEILAYLNEAFQASGVVPTRRELAAAIDYNYQGVCKALVVLADQGLLPEAMLEARERQREARPKVTTCHLHTGDCSPETADRIVKLIENDIEARITFFEMLRGHFRKDP